MPIGARLTLHSLEVTHCLRQQTGYDCAQDSEMPSYNSSRTRKRVVIGRRGCIAIIPASDHVRAHPQSIRPCVTGQIRGTSMSEDWNLRQTQAGKIASVGMLISALALLFMTAIGHAETAHRWDFNKTGDHEGWRVPPDNRGVVMGGSLWLTLATKEKDPAKVSTTKYQVFGDWHPGDPDYTPESMNTVPTTTKILSPSNLNIPVSGEQSIQVWLRVLNLSPVTEFFLLWRTKEQAEGFSGSRRCGVKPDLKAWQEISCHVDPQWRGKIDQIALGIFRTYIRGDFWIDSVEIGDGPAEPIPVRPDVASTHVVPKVTMPGISQAGFADAFKVLDECLLVDVPIQGFTYPVMAAGGYGEGYGKNWYEPDSNLTVTGAKWVNQQFAEDVMRGFRDVQAASPDGRIAAHGYTAMRGQVADVSMLPVFFEVAYDVARRTNDLVLRGEIYESMRKYLDWWLSPVKRDSRTGLISAIGEETFSSNEQDYFGMSAQSVAAVDTNVVVAVGAKRTAELAASLGKAEESSKYQKTFEELSRAINTYLWDEQDGAYYNYDLREGHVRRRLVASTFDPLRLGIASASQRDRLLKRLLDPTQFNWGKLPVTSLAMTQTGYRPDGAWSGSVWTLLNLQIIAGLKDSGRPDLAADLNWATIQEFGNFREYLIPSSTTGEGGGAKRYGWSAAQYIQAVVENLFGVDFDAIKNTLSISPHVPKALYGKSLRLDDLILPTGKGTRLSLEVNPASATTATIRVNISGQLPIGTLLITLPGTAKKRRVPMRPSFTANFQ
ncbi:MAG: hypothetical protein HY508_07175 [Acidobacteria bacterium]|nr:hypothetical protein [Acidobacteriota bacterium]